MGLSLRHLLDQANPFDGGKTYSNPQGAPLNVPAVQQAATRGAFTQGSQVPGMQVLQNGGGLAHHQYAQYMNQDGSGGGFADSAPDQLRVEQNYGMQPTTSDYLRRILGY